MPKQNQVVIAILAGLAVIAGAIFYLNMGASPNNAMSGVEMDAAELAAPLAASSDGDPLATPNPLGELTLGDPAAPITIVEYSSLTCRHCAAFHTETLPALKEKYGFRFLVDDAHGFGTLGATGAGAGEEQGVMDDIDVYFATFAKSMASTGAFIAGDKEVMDFMKYNMRSQVFAKSLQMVLVKGALKRLDMLRTMPELKAKLWENVNALQSGLKERGFDIGTTQSCVTPVYLKGSVLEAMVLVRDLRENYGIFCSIVVYPVIPKGLILLRLIPTSSHTLEDVTETLEAFSSIREKLTSGVYKRLSENLAVTADA